MRSMVLLLVPSFTLWLSPPLGAQGETTSAIVGTVVDQSGGALPGATITVTNQQTGSKRSAKADESGRFSFPQLQPGAYAVKAEAPGFQPQTNRSVFSGPGQKQTVSFTLKVADAFGAVVVTS